MPKVKPSTIYKKRTPSGGYRYYDKRTSKRISQSSYTRRLKSYHTRTKRKNPSSKNLPRKSTVRHKITRRPFKGPYAQGIDFSRRVSIMLSTSDHASIEGKIELFFKEVVGRMKSLKYAMYFHLGGQILQNDGERTPFHLNSNRSFLKEYKKSRFRQQQIERLVNDLFDLSEPHYKAPDSLVLTTSPDGESPEDILLQVIGINQRDKFKGERKRG